MNLKTSLALSIYIIYMFHFFKTTVGFNHPLESILIADLSFLKHPIYNGDYMNRICPFGKVTIFLLVGFLLLRTQVHIKRIYSWIVFGIVFVLSLMNMNAFVYLIPYFLLELVYSN